MLTLRNPVWLVMGLAQPLLYLFFFGPLLKNLTGVPGFPPGDPWQVFVPAIMVMLGLFGSAFVGFGLIQEWRDGVIERMRVTPMSRFALLAGRVLRDGVVLVAQAVLLIGASLLMGLRAPVAGVLVGIAHVAALGMTFAAASYAVALAVKSEDAMAPLINGILLPVMLLSRHHAADHPRLRPRLALLALPVQPGRLRRRCRPRRVPRRLLQLALLGRDADHRGHGRGRPHGVHPGLRPAVQLIHSPAVIVRPTEGESRCTTPSTPRPTCATSPPRPAAPWRPTGG